MKEDKRVMAEESKGYLTAESVIRCTHGGSLKALEIEVLCEIESASILTTRSILAGTFIGCSQVGPGIKPCLKVVQIVKGVSGILVVAGIAAVTSELDFITDGSPPGQRLFEAE